MACFFAVHDGGDRMQIMSVIQVDPEILGGTPCFSGTRVPVKILFELLERGRSLDYFLDGFPTVSREQAVAVLELAREKVVGTAGAAA